MIIGKDTILLQTFPLECIRNKQGFDAPFYYNGWSFPHTALWRGYVATWKVVDDFLLLKKVQKFDSVGTKLNIVEYLENNGYSPKILNGYVVADWYSDILTRHLRSSSCVWRDDRFRVSNWWQWRDNENERVELVFEGGKLIENNIIPIEDFQIGEMLSFEVWYFVDWYIWSTHRRAQVTGVIRENNGKKVLLEIVCWGTEHERTKRRIQRAIPSPILWVNPRYCDRVEI